MKTVLLFAAAFWCASTGAQVQELENFRMHLTRFVWYDTGKIDTIARTEANRARLKKNADDAFMDFVLHPDSKDLETLKAQAQSAGSMYYFKDYPYAFRSFPARMYVPDPKGRQYYAHIMFYGLYDYDRSDFVTMCMQPFEVRGKHYVVYYYSLNGAGTYRIKSIEENRVVYHHTSTSTMAPVWLMQALDDDHVLLVLNEGDAGQSARVVYTAEVPWKDTQSFRGYSYGTVIKRGAPKEFHEGREQLFLHSTRTINNVYDVSYLYRLGLEYDAEQRTLSYTRPSSPGPQRVSAHWENGRFTIDDYYYGEDLSDEDLPVPD